MFDCLRRAHARASAGWQAFVNDASPYVEIAALVEWHRAFGIIAIIDIVGVGCGLVSYLAFLEVRQPSTVRLLLLVHA